MFRNFSHDLKEDTSTIFKTLNVWSTHSTKYLVNCNSYLTTNIMKGQHELYYLENGFPLFLQSHKNINI
jgi:hypothetical protein